MRKTFAALAATAFMLMGCASQPTTSGTSSTPTSTVNQVVQIGASDVQLLANALPAIAAQLQGVKTISASQLASVNATVAQVTTAAQTLAASPVINPNDPVLAQFETGVQAVLNVAAAVLPGNPYVLAAEVILPIAEGVANNFAVAAAMTPDQARAVLRQAAVTVKH